MQSPAYQMCVALLYSVCVCVCVRVRETLLLVAFHVGLCFVLTLYKQIHREALCTPEGLISPLWKAVVALICVFHARKHPDFSALLSQRESSHGRLSLLVDSCMPKGWLCFLLALEARAGMQIWWHSSDQVVVPLLFLLWSHFVQLFVSLSRGETGFCLLRKMSAKAHGSDCFGKGL